MSKGVLNIPIRRPDTRKLKQLEKDVWAATGVLSPTRLKSDPIKVNDARLANTRELLMRVGTYLSGISDTLWLRPRKLVEA